MTDPVILIHGAWQGSWVWSRLLPRLEAAGLTAAAVDLPGNGADGTDPERASLSLYLDHLDGVLAKLGGRASLVGHSGGGIVATAFAERHPDAVSRVAYLAGMMLPSGMTFGDLLRRERAMERGLLGIGPFLEWPRPGLVSAVPARAGADIFLNDIASDEALDLAGRLTPQGENGRALAAWWTAERFGRIPRLYVECRRDLSVTPEMQRRMQDLVPGAMRVALDAGHAPHVSQPGKLAAVLIPWLKGD
ncbi:alkyl salicylate esterase [Zhengella mangrovi]|uniref:Alkyl salicylate esterase n=1 Tax=Zhengella mangrovi TaxID=1982044 RepID=A0A2G1QIS6_9HYPH|nr:alpha/beta hydrolase [Zhengella mangrovi]PHP65361.1 alkyl salicylate esterase [Zhengella mangrovi]